MEIFVLISIFDNSLLRKCVCQVWDLNECKSTHLVTVLV